MEVEGGRKGERRGRGEGEEGEGGGGKTDPWGRAGTACTGAMIPSKLYFAQTYHTCTHTHIVNIELRRSVILKVGTKQTNLRIPPPHKLVPLHRIRIIFAYGFMSGMCEERTEDAVADEMGDCPACEGAEPA